MTEISRRVLCRSLAGAGPVPTTVDGREAPSSTDAHFLPGRVRRAYTGRARPSAKPGDDMIGTAPR